MSLFFVGVSFRFSWVIPGSGITALGLKCIFNNFKRNSKQFRKVVIPLYISSSNK